MKAFTAFVKLFCTVDTGLPSDIRGKSGDMIGFGFAVQSSGSVILKKVGFQLILALVKLFSQTVEQIGDEEEVDEAAVKAALKKGFTAEQIAQKA